MSRVADYSFARPDPAALRAHFVGVMRYLGFGPKVLTPGERDRLFRAGLDVGLVWETTASRMEGGYAAGREDGANANAQADGLGYPPARPIYFANDQNRFTGTHLEYMRGARDTSRRPVGPYGNTALIDACATALGCRYGWKVQTWGPPTSNASLQQMPNIRPPVAGTDVNDTLKADWGQWSGAAQEDDMGKAMAPGVFYRLDNDPKVWYVFGNSRSHVTTSGTIKSLAFIGHAESSNVHIVDHTKSGWLTAIPVVGEINVTVPGAPADIAAIGRAVADELHARLAG